MFEVFTEAARAVMRQSRQHAIDEGSARIDSDHILMALVEQEPYGIGCQTLAKCGVEAQGILSGGSVINRGSDSPESLLGQYPLSESARFVLDRAFAIAPLLQSKVVHTDHIFLALLGTAEVRPSALLERLGADRSALLDTALKLLGIDRVRWEKCK